MAISDFANDGAMGAMGNSDGSSSAGSQSGSAIGSNIVNDWAMNQASGSGTSDATPSTSTSTRTFNEMGPNGKPVAITADNQYGYWGADAGAPMGGGVYDTTGVGKNGPGKNAFGFDIGSVITPEQAAQYHIRSNLGRTSMFEDGGAVPDDGSDGGDVGSLLALALSSVDAGLDYGRKKYGLKQDGGQQMAQMQRTPMVPGNQSESGIPRPQPMPGPLPPTSNPFGKRQQFSANDQQGDNDADDHGGIPDNDADDTETA